MRHDFVFICLAFLLFVNFVQAENSNDTLQNETHNVTGDIDIDLNSPKDGKEYETEDDEKKITFEYDVDSDFEIDYCELIIDGDEEERDNSVEQGENKFGVELDSDEEYDWKIKCVDVEGNVEYSEKRDFEIKEEENNDDRKRIRITDESVMNPPIQPQQDNSISELELIALLQSQESNIDTTEEKPSGFKVEISFGENSLLWIVAIALLILIVVMIVLISRYSR